MLQRQESNSKETSLVTKSAGSNFFPKTLRLVGFWNDILKIKAICKLCLWIFANIFHQHNLHNCRTWSKCVNFSLLKKVSMLVWTPILFQDVQFVEVFLYLKYCEQWITVFHLFEVLNKELFAIFAVNLCQITQWNNFHIKSCTRNTCVNFSKCLLWFCL